MNHGLNEQSRYVMELESKIRSQVHRFLGYSTLQTTMATLSKASCSPTELREFGSTISSHR